MFAEDKVEQSLRIELANAHFPFVSRKYLDLHLIQVAEELKTIQSGSNVVEAQEFPKGIRDFEQAIHDPESLTKVQSLMVFTRHVEVGNSPLL